jgi:DNA-binding CsgD family transcriptional regulator
MIRFFALLVFILSVAIASGAIMLSTRLRNRYRSEIFSALFYFQVFIFTFGFYGIWGQQVIRLILSKYISSELLAKFSETALLLGLPFIVFAWMMLVRFSAYISGRKFGSWMIIFFLIINFSLVFFAGYLIAGSEVSMPAELIRYFFILMNFFYILSSAVMILFPANNETELNKNNRKIIPAGLLLIMILQSVILFLYKSQIYTGLAFIFIFFAGNSFLPVYLTYGVVLPGKEKKPETVPGEFSFDDFCKKFEISPREKDIIREICNGLSNKEISEKLFISLQTVKDHTHRIYIKTNLRNRVQLINLVKRTSDAG